MDMLVAWGRAVFGRLGHFGLAIKRIRPLGLFLATLVAVLLLLVPIPAFLLDVLLALNLALALTLCGFAATAGEPQRLPQLPALLLISVLLRLGLNVAALRLILSAGDGDAGGLIRAAGELLLGGDALVGGVLIAAIGTVLYVVLARGGERVAEVAARFVLDALPGRQAAIEADLRSGAIDQRQAQERRAALDREAQVYGALDGAMRLLKGDAVAALLLLLAGLLGGFLLGVLRQGLSAGEAAERYGLLIIGQGLLIQIPVLLNTAAAGLLLTRGAAEKPGEGAAVPAWTLRPKEESLGITVEAGAALGLNAETLDAVSALLSTRLGFVVPELVPVTATAAGRRLTVKLYGAPLYAGEVPSDVDGRATLLSTLLLATADLLTLDAVQKTLDGLQAQKPALLRETVPRRIDLGRLTALLRRLLQQRVWPLDVRAVLETLATLPKLDGDLDVLTEQVRGGLGRFLIQGLLRSASGESGGLPRELGADGLPALLLSNEIEELIRDATRGRSAAGSGGLFLEPELVRDIIQGIQAAKKLAPEAALLCHADVRRSVEQLLAGAPEALPVLAYSEVPASVKVVVMGRVEPGAEGTGAGATGLGIDRSVPFVDSAAVPWQLRSATTGRSGL
jgi:flagellar biosynthesis component FlhA